jgi:hypothetical protein
LLCCTGSILTTLIFPLLVDGKVLPSNNPSDAQKLNQALMKYRTALDAGQKRDRAIREKLAEIKAAMQKRQGQISQAQRAVQSMAVDVKQRKSVIEEAIAGRRALSNSSLENRIEDSIDLLEAAADLRREQFNHKRNSSTSSAWVQSLPTLPGPLKRSLWYKMHRRRQQVVLRPTTTSLLEGLRKHVEQKHTSENDGTYRISEEAIEAELIRAEQSYLLATHPVVPREEKVSSIPTTSSWAEPGKFIMQFLLCRNNIQLTLLPRRLVFGSGGSKVKQW